MERFILKKLLDWKNYLVDVGLLRRLAQLLPRPLAKVTAYLRNSKAH